jgi:hypothetical protein
VGKQAMMNRGEVRYRKLLCIDVRVGLAGRNAFEAVGETALCWLFEKLPRTEIPEAPSGELEIKDQKIRWISRPAVWEGHCARPSHHEPGAFWLTDIYVDQSDPVHCRVYLSYYGAITIVPGTLGLIRDWSQDLGLFDESGERLAPVADRVENVDQTRRVTELLTRPVRTHPVVVFTVPYNEPWQLAAEDANAFAGKTLGIAQIKVVLPSAMADFRKALGEFAVRGGGIRTYAPGFRLDDDPDRHRFVSGSRLEQIPGGRQGWLKTQAMRLMEMSVEAYLGDWPSPQWEAFRSSMC